MSDASESAPEEVLPAFTVLAGNPTPQQLAAVTAVLDTMMDELEQDARRGSRGRSAWALSQQATRPVLRPGFGAWRSFSA